MNRYIGQLMEEFRQSADSVQGLMEGKKHPTNPRAFEEDVESAKFILLGEYLNIKSFQFPPVKDILSSDVVRVNNAFTKLLHSYGFLTSFPKNVEANLKYERLVALLDREVPILMHHYWRIPTCELDAETCPFGLEYCSCF